MTRATDDARRICPRPLTAGPAAARSPDAASPPGRRARHGPAARRPARTRSSTARSTSTASGRRRSPPQDALRVATERGGFVWLGLYEPTEAELDAIAARLRAAPAGRRGRRLRPPAAQARALRRRRCSWCSRPRRYVEHEELTATSEVVDTGEVMVFLGAELRDHRPARRAQRADRAARAAWRSSATCSASGPSAVLYAVADLVVDDFVDVAGAVEEDVDELEASVFSPERTDDIGRLYQLKRELMSLRRAVSPLEVPLQKLADRQIDVVPDAMRSYFRDVQDHAIRVRDQVGALDELLSSILQASLARTSLADNEDMRKISAWAGIIAVPTAIAGIYGMNFRVHARAATGAAATRWCCWSSLLACVLLYRGFKRNGWL